MNDSAQSTHENDVGNLELDPDKVLEWRQNGPMCAEAAAKIDYTYQVLQQVRWVPDVVVTFALLNLPVAEVQQLVGDQWSKVYTTEPDLNAVAHPQILQLLHAALEKLSENHLKERDASERKEAQKTAREMLLEQAKRQKTK